MSTANSNDRSARLVTFGLLSVGVGLGCLALAFFQIALVLARGRVPGLETLQIDPATAAMGSLLYLMIGAVFIGLGIGSLRRRRWVRPLMLTLAWTWLASGVVALVAARSMLDAILPGATDLAGAAVLVEWAVLGFLAVAGVLMPAAFVWVYRDEALQRTCEAHDTRPAWTERCPVPVLGLSVGLGACAGLSLPMAIRPQLPFFGWLVAGWPAALLILTVAALCALLAWATFSLRAAGWWGTVLFVIALGLSTSVSFARLEPIELYRAMGYPEEHARVIATSGSLTGPVGVALSALFTLVTLVYLARIRKYFAPPAQT